MSNATAMRKVTRAITVAVNTAVRRPNDRLRQTKEDEFGQASCCQSFSNVSYLQVTSSSFCSATVLQHDAQLSMPRAR